MKVWFDHQIFNVQRFGGYTRYFLSLARALRETGRCDPLIVAPAHISGMVRNGDPMHWASWRMNALPWTYRFRPAAFAPWLKLLSRVERPQLVHETHHLLSETHVTASCKLVSTCHDLIPERLAGAAVGSSGQLAKRRLAFERSDMIICVSEATRADFAHFYPALAQRSCVVHHGVEVADPRDALQAGPLPERYVLYVGPRNSYKNFGVVTRAFVRLKHEPDLVLLCFGATPPSPAEREHWQSLGLQQLRLQHTSGDDAWLAKCYTQAQGLIYPSMMEGFGMPLTEAMALGCPVLCSDIAVFREVCGTAALYFDPEQPESLAAQLSGLLDKADTTNALRSAGRLQAARYSWPLCAQQTLSRYEACLQS